MLTPQDLQEVSFEKAKIGGYVMKSVDDFLEPLMDDYLTLYKENAVLKSKMRLLVERLEEYRAGEATMKAALQEAQKTCDEMIAQAEKKSAELVRQAESTAQNKSRDLDSAVEAEQERLGKARSATAEYIAAVEAQIQKQQRTLAALKSITPQAERGAVRPTKKAYDYEAEADEKPSAEEIAAQIEENVGRITGNIPNPDPTATTRIMPALDIERRANEKFADLQFGRNYKPQGK